MQDRDAEAAIRVDVRMIEWSEKLEVCGIGQVLTLRVPSQQLRTGRAVGVVLREAHSCFEVASIVE